MSNPGTSINFDGQALQNLQEAEYRKEEEEQEHEVGQRSDYRKEEEQEHKVGQQSGYRNLNTEMTQQNQNMRKVKGQDQAFQYRKEKEEQEHEVGQRSDQGKEEEQERKVSRRSGYRKLNIG